MHRSPELACRTHAQPKALAKHRKRRDQRASAMTPRKLLSECGHDVNFRCERAVHGAAIDDFDEPGTLIIGEVAGKLNRALDAIELHRLRETVFTILRPDSRMRELHAHARQRPLLSS